VIEEAREYLARLERHQRALAPASPQRQLDLAPAKREIEGCASDNTRDAAAAEVPPQAAQVTPAAAPVTERLRALDVDALSPREALELLYELSAAAKR